MKFSKKEVYEFLKLFADAQPHRFYDQYAMYLTLLKKNMIPITRYAMHNGWVKGVGRDFLKKPLGLRDFILTDKGDDFFRYISIKNGGSYTHYKYFDRELAKHSDAGIDPISIKDAQLN